VIAPIMHPSVQGYRGFFVFSGQVTAGMGSTPLFHRAHALFLLII
jgi:hypothetical protein